MRATAKRDTKRHPPSAGTVRLASHVQGSAWHYAPKGGGTAQISFPAPCHPSPSNGLMETRSDSRLRDWRCGGLTTTASHGSGNATGHRLLESR